MLIFVICSIIILFTALSYYLWVASEVPEPLKWDEEDRL